jgi:hypothetical protein
VCRFHGGAARQSKVAANRRLGEALDRMAKGLLSIAESAESESVRLAAIKEVLNLGGITATTAVEIEHHFAPYEQILSGIAPLTREESRAQRGLPPAPALATDLDFIDAEIVDEGPETTAQRRTERRKRPERPAGGRAERSERRTGPETSEPGIPAGYMRQERAMELAAKANREAGVYPSRQKRGRMK